MAILASKPVSNEPTRQSNKLRSINHEICAPLRLNIALHRLFTFPACFEVEPGHLAEAGLFYRKTTNSVICWFCECEFKTSELDCLKAGRQQFALVWRQGGKMIRRLLQNNQSMYYGYSADRLH
ncbi:uncharacterized protein LOC132200429 isoform X2 [Neocloeon triangulifer]|uniref:uncharacterized protein LOC132200429 isoform X2 n=1 Tax=Neocloeon triangulifer TaxID=2078957 RepID=UPI00286F9032|nr:uncharacterized protein LOC132200429 isoform X2 [Neocloeon triangulifer]